MTETGTEEVKTETKEDGADAVDPDHDIGHAVRIGREEAEVKTDLEEAEVRIDQREAEVKIDQEEAEVKIGQEEAGVKIDQREAEVGIGKLCLLSDVPKIKW